MSAKGTPWFKLHSQLREHPRTDDLADELDIEQPLALGHLVSLWCWVTDYYPDGFLGTMKPRRIEDAVKWRGNAGDFVAACVKHGWIDRGDDGVMRVHNWLVYAESYNRAQAKKTARESRPVPGGGGNTDTCPVSHDMGRDMGRDMSHDTGRDMSHDQAPDILRGEERRGDLDTHSRAHARSNEDANKTPSAVGYDLDIIPDDTILTPGDCEHILTSEQCGEKTARIPHVGAGAGGIGRLGELRDLRAWELRAAVHRTTEGKPPAYLAATIQNGRRDGWQKAPRFAVSAPGAQARHIPLTKLNGAQRGVQMLREAGWFDA